MSKREDDTLVAVSVGAVAVGICLTPILGLWPWLAMGGGVWLTAKTLETFEKLKRR